MYNFFVDLTIWSFAIYGFIKFFEEFILDICCYIVNFCFSIYITFKKFVAKFSR